LSISGKASSSYATNYACSESQSSGIRFAPRDTPHLIENTGKDRCEYEGARRAAANRTEGPSSGHRLPGGRGDGKIKLLRETCIRLTDGGRRNWPKGVAGQSDHTAKRVTIRRSSGFFGTKEKKHGRHFRLSLNARVRAASRKRQTNWICQHMRSAAASNARISILRLRCRSSISRRRRRSPALLQERSRAEMGGKKKNRSDRAAEGFIADSISCVTRERHLFARLFVCFQSISQIGENAKK